MGKSGPGSPSFGQPSSPPVFPTQNDTSRSFNLPPPPPPPSTFTSTKNNQNVTIPSFSLPSPPSNPFGHSQPFSTTQTNNTLPSAPPSDIDGSSSSNSNKDEDKKKEMIKKEKQKVETEKRRSPPKTSKPEIKLMKPEEEDNKGWRCAIGRKV